MVTAPVEYPAASACRTSAAGQLAQLAGVGDSQDRLHDVLDQIDLIGLGPDLQILARTAEPVTVRSLDAIHLATALHCHSGLASFVTYDKRLLDAAQAAGLPVDSPA